MMGGARNICLAIGLAISLAFVAFAVFGLTAANAKADDMKSRAQTALGTANTGGALFSTTRAEKTANAFKAGEPPEAGVNASNIDTKSRLAVISGTTTSKTYGKMQSRPRLTLDPNDSRLDPGKWAGISGVTLMGDLQDGSPRSCTYNDFGSAPSFQRSCDRYQTVEEPKCLIPLVVVAGSPGADVRDDTACLAYDDEPLCAATTLVCKSGAQTRTIDGVDETRLCWEWEQSYMCHAAGEQSNCTPYEQNSACTELQVDCLAHNANGDCSHESALFECGNPDVQANQNCAAIKVCDGSLCEGIPPEPDENFTQAAAWLNVANEAAKDNNLLDASCDLGVVDAQGQCAGGEEVRFFSGKRMTCGKAALSLKNCCRNSGIIVSLFDNCSDAELEIQQSLALKKTTYLGEYCSRSFFGFCLKRSLAFCNFETKFARVFQEEARRTSQISWGGAKHENCAGLTHAEVATLDFEQIDLSELFGDLLDDTDIADPTDVNARLLANMATFGGGTTPDVNTPAAVDENFNETEVSVIPNPDHVPESTEYVLVPRDTDNGFEFENQWVTTPEVGDPFIITEISPVEEPDSTYVTAGEAENERPTLPVTLPTNPTPNPDGGAPTPSPINADQTGDPK